ncbi:hypothetical protein DFP73DRAFT_566532 [Morchella snyderi]|nr:hypothetical protein DFP73DRAFT_566532 [Morchella snyderi]
MPLTPPLFLGFGTFVFCFLLPADVFPFSLMKDYINLALHLNCYNQVYISGLFLLVRKTYGMACIWSRSATVKLRC